MKKITAIETQYAGCRFRSRAEARWAVFFDALKVPWEYEPQGFELPSGRYLPDFWLPTIESWYEVKGATPTSSEMDKAGELADLSGHRVLVAYGAIPHDTDCCGYDFQSHPFGTGARGIRVPEDFDYAWCACPQCGKFGVEYEARGGRICRHDRDDKGYTGDDRRILAAYKLARSARFEFGETPRHASPVVFRRTFQINRCWSCKVELPHGQYRCWDCAHTCNVCGVIGPEVGSEDFGQVCGSCEFRELLLNDLNTLVQALGKHIEKTHGAKSYRRIQMKVNKMLGVTSRRESRADIPVDRITAVITQLKEWLVGEGVDPQKILDPFAA